MFFRFFGRLQLILTEVGVLYPFFICCLSDCQHGVSRTQAIGDTCGRSSKSGSIRQAKQHQDTWCSALSFVISLPQ